MKQLNNILLIWSIIHKIHNCMVSRLCTTVIIICKNYFNKTQMSDICMLLFRVPFNQAPKQQVNTITIWKFRFRLYRTVTGSVWVIILRNFWPSMFISITRFLLLLWSEPKYKLIAFLTNFRSYSESSFTITRKLTRNSRSLSVSLLRQRTLSLRILLVV